MVDISMAGPFAGAALSFLMFCVGLLLSLNPAAAGDLVQVPSLLFQGSLLLGLISRAALGYTCVSSLSILVNQIICSLIILSCYEIKRKLITISKSSARCRS